MELVDELGIHLVVLARYMQVLSDDLCRQLRGPRDQHPPLVPAHDPRCRRRGKPRGAVRGSRWPGLCGAGATPCRGSGGPGLRVPVVHPLVAAPHRRCSKDWSPASPLRSGTASACRPPGSGAPSPTASRPARRRSLADPRRRRARHRLIARWRWPRLAGPDPRRCWACAGRPRIAPRHAGRRRARHSPSWSRAGRALRRVYRWARPSCPSAGSGRGPPGRRAGSSWPRYVLC